MTLGPLLPGRLPNSLAGTRLQQNLALDTRLLLQLQEQISSGKRYTLPSDAPAATSQTINLQKILERNTQLQANVATDRSFLAASEAALASVGDALNQAQTLVVAGLGTSTSSTEKLALADEAQALLASVFNAANTSFRGRYLFGGSQGTSPPFSKLADGVVRYEGDGQKIESYIDRSALSANNVDGLTAFNPQTPPVGGDLDPALTYSTKISDLLGGRSIPLGVISVTLDDTGDANPPQTAQVDLRGTETIGDLRTRLENAFGGGPLTLTVDIDPANNNALRLTPSAGAITVADLEGSTTAANLGIARTAPAAQISGGDLDPRLSLGTSLASLNAGLGIGATAGTGLHITNGNQTKIVDLDAATTIEDVLNALQEADLHLNVGLNEAGNGLAISSRLSGAQLSIGENNGGIASGLGVRTLTGSTRLSDLNQGVGVPFRNSPDEAPIELEITRRDGSNLSLDVSGAHTIQGVLDIINAADPQLTASLNAVGNGISLVDGSGMGALVVADNPVSRGLGIAGSETSNDPAAALVGEDVHPQESGGVFNLLSNLERALRAEDNQALERISHQIEAEQARFTPVRGQIGSQLRVLENAESRLLDDELRVQESLSAIFHTDLTKATTELLYKQQTLEATLRVASQTLQLNLFSFL